MGLESSLAEQYNKTLQSTIGQSQQERMRSMRSAPSQVASTDPSQDWAARQASGFRGAGFNPVSLSNVPQQQIQATKNTFGPATAGGYVEGGQNLEGYYGTTNPYTAEGSNDLLSKAGFSNLGQESSMDLTYANLIPELSNNLMRYEGVGNLGNIYGRNGADPRKIALANEQTLAGSLANQYNSKVNYNKGVASRDFQGSMDNYQLPYNPMVGNLSRSLDYDKLAADRIREIPGTPVDDGFGNMSTPNTYLQDYDVWNFGGTDYLSPAEAEAAKQAQLTQYMGTSKPQQSEYLSQLLTQGGITGRSLGERGSFGGNQINDVISGNLQKLFGSKDITYDGKNYGTILDMAGYETPLQTQWNESSKESSRGGFLGTKVTETQKWDQGGSNLYRSLNNPDWWSQNARNLGNSQVLLTPEQLASSPGFSSNDQYVRNVGSQSSSRPIGGLSNFMSGVGSIVDMFVPWTMGTAKYVGANTAAMMGGASFGDTASNSLKNQLPQWIGGQVIGAGADYVGGAAAGGLTDAGMTAETANMIGSGLSAAATAGGTAALGGASFKDSLKSAVASGLGGALGKGFGGYLEDFVGKDVGATAGNVTGSVAKQGLSNLLSNNKFGNNMGQAAVQGGMASLGNIFAPKGSTPTEVKRMNKVGSSAGSLAKTISQIKKTKAK